MASSDSPTAIFLQNVPAVVGCEVDPGVTGHPVAIQHVHQLPHAPVHLLHRIPVRPVRRLPAELRGRGQGGVHVQPGHQQQKGGAVLVSGPQEVFALLHQLPGHARQVHWLLHEVVVPAHKFLLVYLKLHRF